MNPKKTAEAADAAVKKSPTFVEQLRAAFERDLTEIAFDLAAGVAILVVAIIAARLLRTWITHLCVRSMGERGETIGPLAGGAARVAALILGALTALSQIGIDVTSLMAGAGIVGLAVGFGAQTLVKDSISGFFLIFDDVVRQGDVVKIGSVDGIVETVGLRQLQVRSFDGRLWYIRNGTIDQVGNITRDWARALVEVSVAYEADLKRALEVLEEVGKVWAEEHTDIVLEPPEAQGALSLGGSEVVVRLVVKIDNDDLKLWSTERELRKRVKAAFDANGIEIPFPRRVLYLRQDDAWKRPKAAADDAVPAPTAS